MFNIKDSQRTKVRYAGSVDVMDSSNQIVNRSIESTVEIYPAMLTSIARSTAEIKSNEIKHRFISENRHHNCIKRCKSKTVRKYKISFSYACTTDQDTSNINPKIIDLQRLDKITTRSDHKFVSNKLKPVMTCIVQRLIQEYRRSKEPIRKGEKKVMPSIHQTYSFSNSSCVGDVERDIKLERESVPDLMHSFSTDWCLEDNRRFVKSKSASRFLSTIENKHSSPTYSKSSLKSTSITRCSYQGYARRALSNDGIFKPYNHVRPTLVKDMYLFKRTKTTDHLNLNMKALIQNATLLISLESPDHKTDSICIVNNVELSSAANTYFTKQLFDKADLDHIMSYRRNIHLSECCVVKESIYDKITKGCSGDLLFMSADIDYFDNYNQNSPNHSNYSNENDDQQSRTLLNSSEIPVSEEESKNIKKSKNEPGTIEKDKNENEKSQKRTEKFEQLLVMEKRKENDKDTPTGEVSSLGNKVLEKIKLAQLDTSIKSQLSTFSAMSNCAICHGDPVICLESKCMNSLLEQYATLLEETKDVIVERLPDKTVNIEHFKSLLYEFKEANDIFPSKRVKDDIIRGLVDEKIIKTLSSKIAEGEVELVSDNVIDMTANAYLKNSETLNDNSALILEETESLLEHEQKVENTIDKSLYSASRKSLINPEINNVSLLSSKMIDGISRKPIVQEQILEDKQQSSIATIVYLPEHIVDKSIMKNTDTISIAMINETELTNPMKTISSDKYFAHLNDRSMERMASTAIMIKSKKNVEEGLKIKKEYVNLLRSTIKRESTNRINAKPLKTDLETSVNQSIEIDPFPNNDIFVEIEDNTQTKLIRQKADSNKTPTSVSKSSTTTPIDISTYDVFIEEEQNTSESSSESPDSQDTSEDINSKYANEITNFIEIFNSMSLENEENLMSSLIKPRNEQKYIVGDKLPEKMSKPMPKISHISSSFVADENNKSSDVKINIERPTTISRSIIVEKKSEKDNKQPTVQRKTTGTHAQTDLMADKHKSSRTNSDIQTQTNIMRLQSVNRSVQSDIIGDQNHATQSQSFTHRSVNTVDLPKPKEDIIDKNIEIDNLLNKLRRVLSRSEEYLENFSAISQNLPNKHMENPDTVNIPKDIFLLLNKLCSKDESDGLKVNNDRYENLNQNLENICRSLNAMENKDRRDYSSRLDTGDQSHKHDPNSFSEQNKPNKPNVNFVKSDVFDNSLFDRVVRCVLSKLMDNQNQQFPTQGTSIPTMMADEDFSNVQEYEKNIPDSYDGYSELSRNIGNKINRGAMPMGSASENIDSLIAHCLQPESPDGMNRLRNDDDQLAKVKVYEEIACRINHLLQQIKCSQQAKACKQSTVKIPFSTMNCQNKFPSSSHASKALRSRSASDIYINGNTTKKSVTRHTVASIQNIKSSTNQSRKIKSGFRNLRKELKDQANRLMLNSKTRQKFLCTNVKEENHSNKSGESKIVNKRVCKRKIVR